MPRDGAVRAVLFDWDGTLSDSAEATYRCYCTVFGSFGISYDRERFRATYSPDWKRTYAAIGLPEERWPDADTRWLAAYEREQAGLLPGAREGLARLAEHVPLGLVTSGDRGRVTGELQRLGLAQLFAAAVFGGDVPERKPHPAALLRALGVLGVRPAAAVYVGDSPEDVQMARAAGVMAVAVPGGFPNEGELRAAAPDHWADNLEDALGLVHGMVVGAEP